MLPAALCLLFILFLFWTERARTYHPSWAIVIPIAWMFLAGSRWASSWLNLGPEFASPTDYSEGSPIDAAVFLALIILGIGALTTRKIAWSEVFAKNSIIVLYFLFCLASVAWTDEPYVLFKRWVKDLGNPVAALVILTERRPYEALATVLRRLSFLFLPLSILFIRYFPELGRAYRPDGSPMFTGVGHQKNDLGLICLLAGLYVVWASLRSLRESGDDATLTNRSILAATGLMATYLLYLSNSQTSLVCLIVATVILLLGNLPGFRRRPDLLFAIIGAAGVVLWALQELFDIKTALLALLGRDPSLTNRVGVWEILQNFTVNPIIGAGFMSFWTGARMDEIWRRVGATIAQAHNGYLEQYLNLGYVGLALVLAVIVSGFVHARRQMADGNSDALIRFVIIICAVVYN
ncbi:MAG: O-antigen ligase family protein, partial [Methylocystis sp.]|nr:O-antigen ligase family protein [Methylocystis sp.]